MNLPPTTVFVYGTLMPGERNAVVAEQGGSFACQPAVLTGYRLLHLLPESYPCIVPSAAQDQVRGYALTYTPADWETALPLLDHLEGLDESPPLYARKQVRLQLAEKALDAWVYVYARAERLREPGVIPIPSGNWCEIGHRSERGPDER